MAAPSTSTSSPTSSPPTASAMADAGSRIEPVCTGVGAPPAIIGAVDAPDRRARPDQRVRLVVLFGGRSAEREVSCISAASLLRALDPGRYDVEPVGLTADGRWVRADEAIAALAQGAAALPPALATAGTEVDPLPTVTTTDPDAPVVVFPLLHGPYGEDGTVQGMLELADVAYVGSGVLASALCMDKATAKEVLALHGLPQARWLTLRAGVDVVHGAPGGADAVVDRVDAELGWPAFVKPANMGSSVGVTKVKSPADLPAALDAAFAYDEWVVVEEAIVGREVECAVLGNTELEAAVPGEIVPKAEFYDYDDKYSGEGAEIVVPADLPDDVVVDVRRLAVEAATVLRVEGLARVDFFLEEGGRGLLVNEVNTMPGFTPFSMFPMMWDAAGLPYDRLIDRLVDLALERHGRRAARAGRSRQG